VCFDKEGIGYLTIAQGITGDKRGRLRANLLDMLFRSEISCRFVLMSLRSAGYHMDSNTLSSSNPSVWMDAISYGWAALARDMQRKAWLAERKQNAFAK